MRCNDLCQDMEFCEFGTESLLVVAEENNIRLVGFEGGPATKMFISLGYLQSFVKSTNSSEAFFKRAIRRAIFESFDDVRMSDDYDEFVAMFQCLAEEVLVPRMESVEDSEYHTERVFCRSYFKHIRYSIIFFKGRCNFCTVK